MQLPLETYVLLFGRSRSRLRNLMLCCGRRRWGARHAFSCPMRSSIYTAHIMQQCKGENPFLQNKFVELQLGWKAPVELSAAVAQLARKGNDLAAL